MKRSVTWRLTALMLCALCWDISAKETVDCSVEMTLQARPSPSLDLHIYFCTVMLAFGLQRRLDVRTWQAFESVKLPKQVASA